MVEMTVQKLLKEGIKKLEEREYQNPSLDVQLMLSYLLDCDRIYLHIHRDNKVEPDICQKYYDMIRKRNEGYPLQYMTHSQEFMGLNLYIEEGVLVPRPDTEILVETALRHIQNKLSGKADILDLGTGSGAIALSLAAMLPESQVTAIDASDAAIKTAGINKKRHKINNAEIIKGDIFGNLNTSNQRFDVVVSNPPYIERDTIHKLQTEVAVYEPREALDGGDDGLDYYRQIIKIFPSVSRGKACLIVEIGSHQAGSVKHIFETGGLTAIEVYKDLGGRDRVVSGFL